MAEDDYGDCAACELTMRANRGDFDDVEVAPAPLTWTTDTPTVEGRYAFQRYADSRIGEIRRIVADSEGALWFDYGHAGDLPLRGCAPGYWLGPLPEIEEKQ